MKKPNLKLQIKKPNIDLSRKMPYIFVVTFLVLGIVIVAFGYITLTRAPDKDVVTNMQKEVDDLSVKFDKKKINNLFDTNYSTANVKEPSFPTKNPFLGF